LISVKFQDLFEWLFQVVTVTTPVGEKDHKARLPGNGGIKLLLSFGDNDDAMTS
jgi:hypothetical protein